MPVNMWNGSIKYSLYGGGCGHSSVPAVSGLSSFLPSDDNFSLFLGAGLWEELSTGLSSETLFWNEPVRKRSRSKKVTDEKQNKKEQKNNFLLPTIKMTHPFRSERRPHPHVQLTYNCTETRQWTQYKNNGRTDTVDIRWYAGTMDAYMMRSSGQKTTSG